MVSWTSNSYLDLTWDLNAELCFLFSLAKVNIYFRISNLFRIHLWPRDRGFVSGWVEGGDDGGSSESSAYHFESDDITDIDKINKRSCLGTAVYISPVIHFISRIDKWPAWVTHAVTNSQTRCSLGDVASFSVTSHHYPFSPKKRRSDLLNFNHHASD